MYLYFLVIYFLTACVYFSFIVNLAKAIASKGLEAKNSLKKIAPSFLWLLRDALLQPMNSQGHSCNFQEYLSEEVSILLYNSTI